MSRRCVRRALLVLATLAASAVPVSAQPTGKKKDDPVEKSVERGLRFLANLQEKDGSWQVNAVRSPGVTGLCLMAFLSAGHVPSEGPYGDVVERGLRWVIKAQRADGQFGDQGGMEIYHLGICTMLLAEASGMTDGPLAAELKPALKKAVRVVLDAQRTAPGPHRGGWRYFFETQDADVSVSGWQLLALRAARNVGCDVPAERIDMAVEFLLRCREPRTGAFCYQPGTRPTPACTGTGILALELCGKERHHSHEALQGGGYLLKNPPRWGDEHFFYTAYYSAQAMFQLAGNYWDFYRPRLHQILFDQQQGNGSWLSNEIAGPAYCTAMGILALTVEYRLLPIYQRDEAAAKKQD